MDAGRLRYVLLFFGVLDCDDFLFDFFLSIFLILLVVLPFRLSVRPVRFFVLLYFIIFY